MAVRQGDSDRGVQLRPFTLEDVPRLLTWAGDARFLRQWSGPLYRFPLDEAQVRATWQQTQSSPPSRLMFVAFRQGHPPFGHVELGAIDWEARSCRLGRVLVGQAETRGQGWGRQMVALCLNHAFEVLGLAEVSLRVYSHNHAALACYLNLGFQPSQEQPPEERLGEEPWPLTELQLSCSQWQAIR